MGPDQTQRSGIIKNGRFEYLNMRPHGLLARYLPAVFRVKTTSSFIYVEKLRMLRSEKKIEWYDAYHF